MTVRVKVAALVTALLVISLLAIHFVSHLVLIPSYASLESEFIHTNVHRTLAAIDSRLQTTDATTHDWASWDDTYDYAETRSGRYLESNMVDATFSTIRVNVIAIVDTAGNVLFTKAYDLDGEHEVAPPSDLNVHLAYASHVLSQDEETERVYGILSLVDGPMLFSARPILTSAEEGPMRGVLAMGAFLTESVVAEIADATCLTVSFSPLSESGAPQGGDPAIAPHGFASGDVVTVPLGPDRIEARTTLSDIYGAQTLTVQISQDRAVYAEGQRTLTYYLVVMGAGAAILAFLFLVILDRILIRKLSRLASEVQAIGEHPEFGGEVTVENDDEISLLARSINGTLGSLRIAHERLGVSNSRLEQTTGELKQTEQELRRTANQLRRLTRHLQAIREDERALVASEIHDQVGQGLTALKMDIAAMERVLARGDAPAPGFLDRMTQVVDTLLDTVKRLSSGLRPSMLEDLGLAEAFEWHLAEFGRERSIRTSLNMQGPVAEMESSRALVLFRILQEALQSCAEDAAVTEVAVTLTIEDRYALLAVEDNGNAVDIGDQLSKRGMILSLIRERVEVFGGGMTVTGDAETGTTIVAQLPL